MPENAASESLTLQVLADNPAELDLLGLDSVARAVADVVCTDNTEPLTVGLHGPWGSGKSSLLRHIRSELSNRHETLIVDLNPWEFDDQEDVKGTIIATVLGGLMNDSDPSLTEKLGGLIKRISWTRAAAAVARGAITMSWDFDELAQALTPHPESGSPTTLAGFRDEFATVLDELDADQVVVLIDDLDRCLPGAVLSTLEAVKLFLAVPKMAFVVAADQDMVREAITVGLGETRRSVAFARDYLDKIIQVPIGVPQPTRFDAECYVGILLAKRDFEGELDLEPFAEHADGRRSSGETPYLAGLDLDVLTQAHLHHAQRIVSGLSTDDIVNPRRMKRFINALTVRQYTAEANGVTLNAETIAKLYMLEHRFPKHMRELAEQSATERKELLGSWENWATNNDGEQPDNADNQLKEFLAMPPLLAPEDTEKYFVLARKLLKTRFSSSLSESAQACIRLLLSDDSGMKQRGIEAWDSLGEEDRELVAAELMSQTAIVEEPGQFMRALIEVGEHGAEPGPIVESIHSRRDSINPGVAYLLVNSSTSAFKDLAEELVQDGSVPELARNAISQGKT